MKKQMGQVLEKTVMIYFSQLDTFQVGILSVRMLGCTLLILLTCVWS